MLRDPLVGHEAGGFLDVEEGSLCSISIYPWMRSKLLANLIRSVSQSLDANFNEFITCDFRIVHVSNPMFLNACLDAV